MIGHTAGDVGGFGNDLASATGLFGGGQIFGEGLDADGGEGGSFLGFKLFVAVVGEDDALDDWTDKLRPVFELNEEIGSADFFEKHRGDTGGGAE